MAPRVWPGLLQSTFEAFKKWTIDNAASIFHALLHRALMKWRQERTRKTRKGPEDAKVGRRVTLTAREKWRKEEAKLGK